jgi:rsbT co-antagonist protein RsbR
MSTLRAKLTHITSVSSGDPDVRRRGQLLVNLAIGILLLLLLVALPLSLRSLSPGRVLNLVLAAAVFGLAFWLGHSGRVTAGAYIVITASILGSVSGSPLNTVTHYNLFFLIISVLLASILLKPTQIWLVLGICLSAIVGIGAMLPPELRAEPAWMNTAPVVAFMLIVVSFIAYIGARSAAASLEGARVARREAELSEQALAANNAALERRVEERTAELRALVEHHQADAEALQTSLQAQQTLNRVIADLAVPVMPVRHDTLVVPLVGNIDSARADQILSSVLTRVERGRIRRVILDVTGVAVVDTQVSAALLRVAVATRLMGAGVILAGIRPEVAQSLVGLGVDLRELQTVSTLQEALT